MQRNGLNLGLVTTATLAPVIFGIISYKTGAGTWFGRSGSLMTLLAAIVQFRIALELEGSQYRALFRGVLGGLPRRASLAPLSRILGPASLILIVMGTLIWGYGDLLFDKIP
jgi:hypothetical protein